MKIGHLLILFVALFLLSGTVEARMMNPQFGRFISRDPARNRDGASLYEYVRSRPITGTDAKGLCGSFGGISASSTCGSASDPWSDPRWITPYQPGGLTEECKEACKNGGYEARGWCVNGSPVICVCDSHRLLNPGATPKAWREGYSNCLWAYEWNNWDLGIISCPSGHTGAPDTESGTDGWCAKAMNVYALAGCVKDIYCPEGSLFCTQLRCRESRFRNCIGDLYTRFCMGGLDPASQEAQDAQQSCTDHYNDPCGGVSSE